MRPDRPRLRHAQLIRASLAAIAVGSCGGPGTDAPTVTPTRLTVSLSYDTLSIGAGAQATARASSTSGIPVQVAVTWSVSDAAVVGVTQGGVVTAIAPGSARVIATTGSLTGAATVTVRRTEASDVVLSTLSAVMEPGDSLQLGAQAIDASGRRLDRLIRWLSSDTTVTTVDARGLVRARGSGVARVAAIADSVFGTVAIRVSGPAGPVDRVTLTPDAATLRLGSSLQLLVLLEDAEGDQATGRAVVFASSDARVATVSPEGLVTPIAAGRASISATSEGKRGTADVVVLDPRDDITFSCIRPDTTDVVGDTLQILCKVEGASEIVTVEARVELESTRLLYPYPGARGPLPLWWNNMDMSAVKPGVRPLRLEATDSRGNKGIYAVSFTRGARTDKGGTTLPPRAK